MRYWVEFIGLHFRLGTRVFVVDAIDDDQIIAKANVYLKDYYGWDVAAVSQEIEVEEV